MFLWVGTGGKGSFFLPIRAKEVINMCTDIAQEMSKAILLYPIKTTQKNNTINKNYKTQIINKKAIAKACMCALNVKCAC